MKTSVALLALTLNVAACSSFGPPRDPPQMPTPAHYAVNETPAQLALADGVAQHLAIGARPVPEWWKEYRSDALDALVEEGLRNSPSLAAAQSTLKAAREGLRAQVGASMSPSVDVGFSPSRQRALGLPTLPQETFLENIYSAQLKASYTFDFFGAAVLADRALGRQVQQQAFQLESTRRALAANIVVSTIRAASLQEQVTATEQMVLLGEQRAQQTAARHKQGSASRDDMLAAEQDAANAAATLPSLRAQTLAIRHALAVLLGRTPDQAPALLLLEALHLPDTLPVALPSELLRQRPDILAAEAAVRATAVAVGTGTAPLVPAVARPARVG